MEVANVTERKLGLRSNVTVVSEHFYYEANGKPMSILAEKYPNSMCILKELS